MPAPRASASARGPVSPGTSAGHETHFRGQRHHLGHTAALGGENLLAQGGQLVVSPPPWIVVVGTLVRPRAMNPTRVAVMIPSGVFISLPPCSFKEIGEPAERRRNANGP